MRKIMIALMAASTAFAVAPAVAQDWRGGGYENDRRGPGYNQGPRQQLERVRMEIDRATQRGRLDRREAGYFQQQLRQLYQLDARYRRGGYDRNEQRDLQQRIGQLSQRVRYAANGNGGGWRNDDRRDDGRWDRNDRDDRGDRYDRRDRDDDRRDDDDDD